MQAVQLTRTHRILVAVVVIGAVTIAAIGFAGSFAAVRDLAEQKGFGAFAPFFPIGIDAGIVVLLALDLLLTWIRIPFPLLRQTAWLLTAATIAFNGAAAWPDPLGVGMHAVIPVLFVVSVEAARHAIGRIADITADKHMEGVRVSRWLLAFPSTFKLWRRMKLWELRSYDEVIRMEQDRLVYEARLQARFGRGWRRKAPIESLMPLKLARYGVPLSETGPTGLAAAGIEAPATRESDRPPARAAKGLGERPAALTAGEPPRDAETAAAPSQPPQAPQPARSEPDRPRQAPAGAGHAQYAYEFTPEPQAPAPPAAEPVAVPARAPQQHAPETAPADPPSPDYTYAAETQPNHPGHRPRGAEGRRRALGNASAPSTAGTPFCRPNAPRNSSCSWSPRPRRARRTAAAPRCVGAADRRARR